ncbi:hypothetical protein [Spirochaeta isovalerica]|uniref:Uncharacterized protein n=1 Tax=Spirochaeta isovalerica TaxID=150 RepID=A0A841R639_9SPIO|nr:hypothetical protein [Spirochaeta isovalerica]MBB6479306.1 hypothetical protein [Spirochaeta isovalerica]
MTPDGSTGGDSAVIPVIPDEFSEMKAYSYSGADLRQDSLDFFEPLIRGLEIVYTKMGKLSVLSTDEEISELKSFVDLIQGRESEYDYGTARFVKIDPLTYTGSVVIGFDEAFGGTEFTGDLFATLNHENLIVVDQDTYEPVFDYILNSNEEKILQFQNASISASAGLSDVDVKVLGATGSDGIRLEYFRLLADVSLSASGDDLTTMGLPVELTGDDLNDSLEFLDGSFSFDAAITLKMAMVYSSGNPDMPGCKVVATIDLDDDVSDISLNGLDVFDEDQLFNKLDDILIGLSFPTITLDFFDSDNNFLFRETVPVINGIESCLFYL